MQTAWRQCSSDNSRVIDLLLEGTVKADKTSNLWELSIPISSLVALVYILHVKHLRTPLTEPQTAAMDAAGRVRQPSQKHPFCIELSWPARIEDGWCSSMSKFTDDVLLFFEKVLGSLGQLVPHPTWVTNSLPKSTAPNQLQVQRSHLSSCGLHSRKSREQTLAVSRLLSFREWTNQDWITSLER